MFEREEQNLRLREDGCLSIWLLFRMPKQMEGAGCWESGDSSSEEEAAKEKSGGHENEKEEAHLAVAL